MNKISKYVFKITEYNKNSHKTQYHWRRVENEFVHLTLHASNHNSECRRICCWVIDFQHHHQWSDSESYAHHSLQIQKEEFDIHLVLIVGCNKRIFNWIIKRNLTRAPEFTWRITDTPFNGKILPIPLVKVICYQISTRWTIVAIKNNPMGKLLL
jgi:hypothetical protein